MNNKNYIFESLVVLGLYFVITLPISLYQYNSRYDDYKTGKCIFNDYQLIPTDGLYKLNSNITVNNCTEDLSICCNNYNYWNQTINKNNTNCFYNQNCDIIPEFIKNTSFNLFEISSFIFGVLFAINIIVLCESKRRIIYMEYQEIN